MTIERTHVRSIDHYIFAHLHRIGVNSSGRLLTCTPGTARHTCTALRALQCRWGRCAPYTRSPRSAAEWERGASVVATNAPRNDAQCYWKYCNASRRRSSTSSGASFGRDWIADCASTTEYPNAVNAARTSLSLSDSAATFASASAGLSRS